MQLVQLVKQKNKRQAIRNQNKKGRQLLRQLALRREKEFFLFLQIERESMTVTREKNKEKQFARVKELQPREKISQQYVEDRGTKK